MGRLVGGPHAWSRRCGSTAGCGGHVRQRRSRGSQQQRRLCFPSHHSSAYGLVGSTVWPEAATSWATCAREGGRVRGAVVRRRNRRCGRGQLPPRRASGNQPGATHLRVLAVPAPRILLHGAVEPLQRILRRRGGAWLRPRLAGLVHGEDAGGAHGGRGGGGWWRRERQCSCSQRQLGVGMLLIACSGSGGRTIGGNEAHEAPHASWKVPCCWRASWGHAVQAGRSPGPATPPACPAAQHVGLGGTEPGATQRHSGWL